MAKYWRTSLNGRPLARAISRRRWRTDAAKSITGRLLTGWLPGTVA
jgi:hypothetical protein